MKKPNQGWFKSILEMEKGKQQPHWVWLFVHAVMV
jgi:hypothetical protein